MAYQLAANLLESDTDSIIGGFLIHNHWISWPLYLSGIYLEVFAVYSVFRPTLHKILGIFLILFHISENIFILGLFFVLSPLKEEKFNIKKILVNLPIMSLLMNRLIK